jgi:acyl-CoA reductase-like NAD-dependent aldehyde dehydrogenase
VTDSRGRFLANPALASRKDARDAVVAARKAFPAWSSATAYNRGQVLYRVAELLEGRRSQFVEEVAAGEGLTARKAEAAVDTAIDRWVWYAGWADKVMQVHGSANPVAGPYFDFSVPEPTGVVAVIAPQESSLLGLVSVLAPVIVTATPSSCWPVNGPRCRRSRSRRCSPPPTCPPGWSTCSPAAPPKSRRGWPRTWTSTRSTSRVPRRRR